LPRDPVDRGAHCGAITTAASDARARQSARRDRTSGVGSALHRSDARAGRSRPRLFGRARRRPAASWHPGRATGVREGLAGDHLLAEYSALRPAPRNGIFVAKPRRRVVKALQTSGAGRSCSTAALRARASHVGCAVNAQTSRLWVRTSTPPNLQHGSPGSMAASGSSHSRAFFRPSSNSSWRNSGEVLNLLEAS
jgi:hypothetical protein